MKRLQLGTVGALTTICLESEHAERFLVDIVISPCMYFKSQPSERELQSQSRSVKEMCRSPRWCLKET